MDRRIFGLENEYGVTCTFRGQRRLSPDEVARYLFRRVVSWGRSSNVFLRNGARLYLDVGSHPEYATPECDSLIDLVTHDKAGERILEGLLVDADTRLREEGIAGDIYLFKNNTDSAGNSYGCHENYLVGRHGEFGRLADVLIPFLVTRQIICGAGKVLQTPRGAVYCVSQRAEHIWEGVSSATTRSVTAIFSQVVNSLMFESPTITCSRRNRSASACGSSLVLMIGRDLVVAEDTLSQMCSARWLTQYTAPRGVCSTLPAPQITCRVTRNGIKMSASLPNSPCRPTR